MRYKINWRLKNMDIESTIKTIIIEQLNIELDKTMLFDDTNLQVAGMDSIKFIKMIVEIESTFDIEYPDEKLLITESGTLKQVIEIIENCLKAKA